MIRIFNDVDRFEYDVRGLVMAFYAGKDMVYNLDEEPSDGDFIIRIHWDERKVTVSASGESEAQSFDPEITVEAKTAVKDCMYRLFSRMTGIVLPWGTLTGIRPTKIPMSMLEDGASDDEIIRHMREDLLVTEQKSLLALDIAKREKALLDKLDCKNGYSLYIGIPFCPSTCLYCSFTSYPISVYKDKVDEYLDNLEKELSFLAENFKGRQLDTIYVGGGTPTTLLPYQIDRLCGFIEEHFDLSRLLEWTIEAGRPDSVTPEKLDAIKRHRVDRISINPQTMKQGTLRIIGRLHTVEDVKRVFHEARDKGFDNINMDLIMGLPDESIEDVRHTLEEVGALDPDNLTVHSLALKRSSRLNLEKEKYADYAYQNTPEQMELTAEFAASKGLEPYYLYRQKNMAGNFENVGYAKPGKAGIYNILIMEEKQSIVACGAGTVTKRVFPDGRIERCDTVKDVKLYMKKIDEMIDRKKKLFEL